MAGIEQPNRQSKYKTITISVIIFLTLLGILLAGNFYLSYRQSEITLKIDALGEASDAAYDLLIGIQQLHEQQLQKQALSGTETVQEAQQTIDHLLTLLHTGGSYTMTEKTVSLQPLTSSEAKTSLAKMDDIWQTYQKQLTVLNQDNADISRLNDYAIAQKEPIYNTLNEIIVVLTEESRQISTYIGILQIVGVCLMVLYFLLFVFYCIRQMKQSDAILEAAS